MEVEDAKTTELGLVHNPSKLWLSHRIMHAMKPWGADGPGASTPPGAPELDAEHDDAHAEPQAPPHVFLRIVGATSLFAVGGALSYWLAEATLDASTFGGRGFGEAYGLALFGLVAFVLAFRALCVGALPSERHTSDHAARRTALMEIMVWGLAGVWMPTLVLATASYVWVPVLAVLAGGLATHALTTGVARRLAPAR